MSAAVNSNLPTRWVWFMSIALKSKPASLALKSKTTSFIAAFLAVCIALNLMGAVSVLAQQPIEDVATKRFKGFSAPINQPSGWATMATLA